MKTWIKALVAMSLLAASGCLPVYRAGEPAHLQRHDEGRRGGDDGRDGHGDRGRHLGHDKDRGEGR